MEDLSPRPILDTEPDRQLFAARNEELSRLLSSVKTRRNALVTGDRGSGKTSLLRRLAFDLRQSDPTSPPPVFVDGHLATDATTFLELVRYRLGLAPLVHETTALVPSFQSRKPIIADTLQLTRLVASLRQATGDVERVILVDELPSAAVGHTVFGRLRDELWQLPFTWVVAVSEGHVAKLLAPPADAFFEVVVTLHPLTSQQQKDVLATRAGQRGSVLARKLDEGNIRRLLGLARETLERNYDPSDLARAQQDRMVRASKLGRSASMLLSELESLGPVSASDDALLQRLGWTRTRAVQVLNKLEDAGLVTSSEVKGDAGRPRKVYRLTDFQSDPYGTESAT